MEFAHVFDSFELNEDAARAFGFDEDFVFRQATVSDFALTIKIDRANRCIVVAALDSFGEPYGPFDVESANGPLVSQMRYEAKELVSKIVSSCFKSTRIREKILQYAKEDLGATADHPFSEDDDSWAIRNPKGKWIGLIMNIKCTCLGFSGEEHIDIMNIKADPAEIPSIVDNKYFFPAYHMNKKYWITIFLGNGLDLEKTYSLFKKSYELTSK